MLFVVQGQLSLAALPGLWSSLWYDVTTWFPFIWIRNTKPKWNWKDVPLTLQHLNPTFTRISSATLPQTHTVTSPLPKHTQNCYCTMLLLSWALSRCLPEGIGNHFFGAVNVYVQVLTLSSVKPLGPLLSNNACWCLFPRRWLNK